MDNNDFYRRIRYALQLDDADTLALLAKAGAGCDQEQVATWRIKEGQPYFQACPTEIVSAMLDGLILDRRGPPPESSKSKEGDMAAPLKKSLPGLDNNVALKQLRIALSLKADEVHALIVKGGGKIGKSEVNALFRNSTARNYRRCGDQVLRWFLNGLASTRED